VHGKIIFVAQTIYAGQHLVKEWDTALFAHPSFFATMVTVRLPEGLIPVGGPEIKMVDNEFVYDSSHGSYIGKILRQDYQVEVYIIIAIIALAY